MLATSSLGLVRARPGLHPGDLSLRPEDADLAAERRRMGRRTTRPPPDAALVDAAPDGSAGVGTLAEG